MIGGDEEIRVVAHLWIRVEVVEDLLQISIGVLDGRLRRRAVDAGRQLIQAVPLRVLRVIGIARPVHEHERLGALRKRRQYRLGRGVGEPLLMLDVRGARAGHGVRARRLIARRRRRRQPGRFQQRERCCAQRDCARRAGRPFENDGDRIAHRSADRPRLPTDPALPQARSFQERPCCSRTIAQTRAATPRGCNCRRTAR